MTYRELMDESRDKLATGLLDLATDQPPGIEFRRTADEFVALAQGEGEPGAFEPGRVA